ncbi:DUF4007 family protein [Streptomyces althioticus]|uniref:DUF4007 domain-containing protein n=2 Tax=Streptomyces TaxID=1883 RepID=A0A101NTY3_9ACTN|nr:MULTISPECIES: DUF4007 family protein [Streptomyces]KEG39391.1 hypothetical protein DJ64_14525 [Streptomyces griseorubens]KUM99296.1 hypothetical protein AQI95_39285 [Streptomyces yokosukanensis]
MSDSRLGEAALYSFARHETFAPRFGWLHKAYMQVKRDQGAFLAADAPVRFGVGKNMVNAMRYWSRAFKLTRECNPTKGTQAKFSYPTWEARWLLDEDGADPYLEENGSLWLLHWWLVSSRPGAKSHAPAWYTAFHLAPFSRFTVADMTQVVTRHVNFSYDKSPEEASIVKDIECLTKMYARSAPEKAGSPGSYEDLLACPFRDLDLLTFVGTRGNAEWQFTSGHRTSLPARVLAYACLDYAAKFSRQANSISVARLANEPGSPGRAFRVRENEIVTALQKVAADHPQLDLTEAVGQRSLAFSADPFDLAWEVLDEQYDFVTRRPGFPTREEWAATFPKLAEAEQKELATKATDATDTDDTTDTLFAKETA